MNSRILSIIALTGLSFNASAVTGPFENFPVQGQPPTNTEIIIGDNGRGNGRGTIPVLRAESPRAVPVPAALWLLGSGLIGLGIVSRRKV